jgi:hypothetical protein
MRDQTFNSGASYLLIETILEIEEGVSLKENGE